MAALREFIDNSLDHVSPEFERNFTLIKELDQRTSDIIPKVNELIKLYQQSRSKNERQNIKEQLKVLNSKIMSYADDKVALAEQTYELVDRNIHELIGIGNPTDQMNTTTTTATNIEEQQQIQLPIGMDMPLDPNEPKYCTCQGVSAGEMIACDNKDCLIEWFHYSCVNLIVAPSGKWFCPECRQTMKKPRRKRNRGSY